MSKRINGASGIPIQGREVEYATELWLEGPSAFWLHPEGPLSDKTPEEWMAEQEAKKPKIDLVVQEISAKAMAMGLQASHAQMAVLQNLDMYRQRVSPQHQMFGSLFGNLL